MKYQVLYDRTMAQGGATIRVRDYPEKIVTPISGFAVGNTSDAIMVNVEDTEAFDTSVERQLTLVSKAGDEFLGTWIDKGEIYIEPVNVFARKAFALGVAWARGEKSIYDLAKKREIRIKYG